MIRSILDICAGRHGGNKQSQAAFQKVDRTRAEKHRVILAFIREQGVNGATSKEVAAYLNLGEAIYKISGRLTELKAAGLIVETDRRREGCGVVVAPEFAEVAA